MYFSDNFRQIIGEFFTFIIYIKMLHWQTDSYAQHKTTDALLIAIDPLFDQFMETLQGDLGQKVNISSPLNIVVNNMTNLSSQNILDYLSKFESFLSKDLEAIINSQGIKNKTALLNIRDEVLGEVQKTKYLMTFK
jgi:hypothetical protein